MDHMTWKPMEKGDYTWKQFLIKKIKKAQKSNNEVCLLDFHSIDHVTWKVLKKLQLFSIQMLL